MIDNPSAVLIRHVRGNRRCHNPLPVDIHIKHLLQIIQALIGDVQVHVDGGVVEQHIHSAVMLHRSINAGLRGVGIGYVGLHEDGVASVAHAVMPDFASFGVKLSHHDLRPFVQKPLGVCQADALTCAGYDGYFVFKSHGR